jgi:signal transduction histidine kinase
MSRPPLVSAIGGWRDVMAWRGLKGVVAWYSELTLAVVFLGMAFYELLEIWTEPFGVHGSTLGLMLHCVQVVLIVTATAVLLRAWRGRTAHANELARLVGQVIYAREQERRRIAYEIHDGIAPLIVSAKQHLDTARDVAEHVPRRAERDFDIGLDRLDRAITEIRRILQALGPSAVAARPLAAAMREDLAETAHDAGWATNLTDNLDGERLPADVETAVFRIFQESVANAARHARSTRIEVGLTRADGWVTLDVRDDGVGFEPTLARNRGGLGLTSMVDRAQLLGGTCTIDSRPNRGTRVTARLPLKRDLRDVRD